MKQVQCLSAENNRTLLKETKDVENKYSMIMDHSKDFNFPQIDIYMI